MNRLQGWHIPILTTCLVHGAITVLPINFGYQKEEADTQEITFRLVSLSQKSFPPSSAKQAMIPPKKKPSPPKVARRSRLTNILPKSKVPQHSFQEKINTQEESDRAEEAPATTDMASLQPEVATSGSEKMSPDPVILSTELSVICLEFKPPAYPRASRQHGEYGDVVLKLVVDENGHVEAAQVINSSGYKRLDEAAMEAIKTWRCNPSQRNGQPVRAIALQPFSFVLQ